MVAALQLTIERDGIKREVSVDADRVIIGRAVDCEVSIEDPLASRQHCCIERLGDELFVVDLNSANGTWLGNTRVGRELFAPGDQIRIGSTMISLLDRQNAFMRTAEATQTQQQSRELGSLRTLLSVLRNIRVEEDVERAAGMLIDAAVSLTTAERGFVFLVEQGEITLAIGRNFAHESVPAPENKLSATLLEKALKSDRPLILRDAASDGEFAGVASISDLGLRSLLALPLRHGRDVFGLLVVDHRLASGAFSNESVELLGGLADVASTAIGAIHDRAKLKALQRSQARLKRRLSGRRASTKEAASEAAAVGAAVLGGMIGGSPVMSELFQQLERLMETDVPVLVQGESGTGKELVARALHHGGLRSGKAYVVENCGALPDTLLESELFGHVKGAFTGAIHDKDGRFVEADGGTLFLDEVGAMSSAMQQRLLRVLQEGEFRPLGSDRLRHVNVRIIAATNLDLRHEVDAGRFREDLYYRLKVLLVEVPPLRDRSGDIPVLCQHFLRREAAESGFEQRQLGGGTMAALEASRWPGNVRQLENEMRRLSVLGSGEVELDEISSEILADVRNRKVEATLGLSLPEQVEKLERELVTMALERCEGNQIRAAEELGITRYALKRKLQKYAISPAEGE